MNDGLNKKILENLTSPVIEVASKLRTFDGH